MKGEKEEKSLVLSPELLYIFTEGTVKSTPEGKVSVL
jgi:hypothetical protein